LAGFSMMIDGTPTGKEQRDTMQPEWSYGVRKKSLSFEYGGEWSIWVSHGSISREGFNLEI
jgi:hypothetical protein